jgi:hypothetical protein
VRSGSCVALLALLLPAAASGEMPGAVLALEVQLPPSPGRYPEAAPPRFVLLEKGQFFVGGQRQIGGGKLEGAEIKALETRLQRIRKLQGLGSQVAFGTGGARYRLQVFGKHPLEITATGDPKSAPPALLPLASLLSDLADFDHPSLRLLRPDSFLLVARDGALPGGCRRWSFGFPPAEAGSGRVVSAAEASDWPQGVDAAAACLAQQRYVVTLRPLFPGERP